eukprot:1045361-Amphidinium_carterae.1
MKCNMGGRSNNPHHLIHREQIQLYSSAVDVDGELEGMDMAGNSLSQRADAIKGSCYKCYLWAECTC